MVLEKPWLLFAHYDIHGSFRIHIRLKRVSHSIEYYLLSNPNKTSQNIHTFALFSLLWFLFLWDFVFIIHLLGIWKKNRRPDIISFTCKFVFCREDQPFPWSFRENSNFYETRLLVQSFLLISWIFHQKIVDFCNRHLMKIEKLRLIFERFLL